LNTASFWVTRDQRIQVSSAAPEAVSKNGVLPMVHSPLMTECQVSPNAPGVPWPGVKLVVEIAPACSPPAAPAAPAPDR
jgi:hypothetical protein